MATSRRRNNNSMLEEEEKLHSQAALSHRDVIKIRKDVLSLIDKERNNFNSEDKQLWTMMQAVLEDAKAIQSCDLPTDSIENTDIVFYVQQLADFVLGNPSKFPVKGFDPSKASLLEKIFKISALAKSHAAGNCQEKAFYGFHNLLKRLIAEDVVNFNKTIQLELAYFNNHFIVLVNGKFLLDPWLDLVFPLPNSLDTAYEIFSGFGKLKRFFVLAPDWQCYSQVNERSDLSHDLKSGHYAYTLFPTPQAQLEPAAASHQALEEKKPSLIMPATLFGQSSVLGTAAFDDEVISRQEVARQEKNQDDNNMQSEDFKRKTRLVLGLLAAAARSGALFAQNPALAAKVPATATLSQEEEQEKENQADQTYNSENVGSKDLKPKRACTSSTRL